jgi:hypothetical protein
MTRPLTNIEDMDEATLTKAFMKAYNYTEKEANVAAVQMQKFGIKECNLRGKDCE